MHILCRMLCRAYCGGLLERLSSCTAWSGLVGWTVFIPLLLPSPSFLQLQLLSETQQRPSNLMQGKCCFVHPKCIPVVSDLNRQGVKKRKMIQFLNSECNIWCSRNYWIKLGGVSSWCSIEQEFGSQCLSCLFGAGKSIKSHPLVYPKKVCFGGEQSLPSLGCVCVFNTLINFYWVVEKLMSELHCGWTRRNTRL